MASQDVVWLIWSTVETFNDYCDNQSCTKLTENPVFHDRSKHIEIKYHFIKDYVQKGAVKLEYIPTNE